MAATQTIQIPRHNQALVDQAGEAKGQTNRVWYRWMDQLNRFVGGAAGPDVPTVTVLTFWALGRRNG
jgi:hypothetical protein